MEKGMQAMKMMEIIKILQRGENAMSREEIQRFFQQSGLLHGDETPVPKLGAGDIDVLYFNLFFEQQFGEPLLDSMQPLPQLLENMNLMTDGTLNVAGSLLFAKAPQYALPAFIVKAVAFAGNHIEDEHYIDSRDMTGKLVNVFEQCLAFLLNNTRAIQGGQSVNSLGKPEIPRIVWEELLVNALIHRDYFISAPVRILVFTNRIEIISPGHLPNHLTIENIKAGNSREALINSSSQAGCAILDAVQGANRSRSGATARICNAAMRQNSYIPAARGIDQRFPDIRNPVLASFAAKILPYRGLGSGLLRALRAWPRIELIDDREGNLFKVIVTREQGV